MILNEKTFVKSIILNKIFFVLSDFEGKFIERVRFQIIFKTRVRFRLEYYTAHQIFCALLLQFAQFSYVL